MKVFISVMTILFTLFAPMGQMGSAEKSKDKPSSKIPKSVLDISKENTYPNPTEDLPYLQPSELTESLIETAEVEIENPDLIRILNESTISGSKFALGFKATIYLGQWPLNYESRETNTNWEYKKINTNHVDNRGGQAPQKIKYVQEAQKSVEGGLSAEIPSAEDVKKMMLLKAIKKTNLPLAFKTIVGRGTKTDQVYNIAPKKLAYLYGYVPAVNEKGKVTFGEVYLELKGGKHRLIVKNITHQGIGAWIPVQDHVSFKFYTSDTPR